jgi:hypothetical protein
MPPHSLNAAIQYMAPCKGKPVIHGSRRELDNFPLESRSVRITNVRSEPGTTSLEEEGFALLQHKTTVTDFLDPGQVQNIYLGEMSALLQKLTGAEKVVPGNSVIRRSERSARFRQDQTTVPGRFVHCDFTPTPSGSRYWVERLLPAEEARERLLRRFAIYNIWRVLSDPPQDTPLALCDLRSLGPYDRVSIDCHEERDPETVHLYELSSYRYSASHRWCYYPDMTRDEILVFRGFDSEPGREEGVPHVAFDDPACPVDAPARENIDARFLVFY